VDLLALRVITQDRHAAFSIKPRGKSANQTWLTEACGERENGSLHECEQRQLAFSKSFSLIHPGDHQQQTAGKA
jgi:hypothetical protein